MLQEVCGGWDHGEMEPIVPSKRPANRISTELTAGEEFDYKLIKSNFCQVCVIILFDRFSRIQRIYWANADGGSHAGGSITYDGWFIRRAPQALRVRRSTEKMQQPLKDQDEQSWTIQERLSKLAF